MIFMSDAEPTACPSEAQASVAGLRERSKAKRRRAIQLAALRLFAERGYEHTTIAEIADAAEVAPRTISGYFASKVDLATSATDDLTSRLVATFVANPDAGLLEVLDRWLTEEEQFTDHELAALTEAAYQRNPALRSLLSARMVDAVEVVQAALVAESGLAGDHPMTTIFVAAMGAALAAYFGVFREHGTSPELHRAVLQFVQGMLDGLPSS
jgi:AcrR family transcriptional regulator